MSIHLWIAALVALIGTQAGDLRSSPPKGEPRAAALMEEAAQTRYVWSPQVAGVTGRFTWNRDGQSGAGTFRDQFHKPGGLTIAGEGSSAIPDEIKDHVGSMIAHRTPSVPAASSRPSPGYVIVVEDDERGPLIMTLGDPMQSTQRVKDGRLVQVNRAMEGKRFTIDVTRFEKTPDGRVYPADFTVTWWDQPTGKRVEKQSYTTEGFEVIEGQLFPKAEKVVSDKGGKSSTLRVEYSDVKFEMLPGARR